MAFNIQSSVTKQTLSEYTTIINSVVVKALNESIGGCVSDNVATWNIGTVPPCSSGAGGNTTQILNSNLSFIQNALAQCNFSSVNSVLSSQTFNNEVKSQTKQFITNNLKNSQGFFAIGFSLQSNSSVSQATFNTAIDNAFNENITNICKNFTFDANQFTINLCGYYDGDNFDFTQNAINTSITSCINKTVIDIFVQNQVLNNFAQNTDNALVSAQAGPLTGAEAIIRIAIILAAILVGLLIVGGIIVAIYVGSKAL